MSNNPYPSRRLLHEEEIVERLLAEQGASVLTFQQELRKFRHLVDALRFPLGSPVRGYDLPDIDSVLAELTVPRVDYADAAADLAREAA